MFFSIELKTSIYLLTRTINCRMERNGSPFVIYYCYELLMLHDKKVDKLNTLGKKVFEKSLKLTVLLVQLT